MSIFQCEECGCAENTACGWYHSRNSKRLNKPEDIGRALCSACAKTKWKDGSDRKGFTGVWHGLFERTYLPRGKFKTNQQGNLEHIESGLVGGAAYEAYGSDKPHIKDDC